MIFVLLTLDSLEARKHSLPLPWFFFAFIVLFAPLFLDVPGNGANGV